MSNNFASQQLQIPSKQVDQMEPIPNKLDSSISNMQMGMIRPMSNYAAPQQLVISENQMRLVRPMSSNPGLQSIPVLNNPIAQIEPQQRNIVSQHFLIPNQHVGQMDVTFSSMGSSKLLLPSKRKELMSDISAPLQLPTTNKRMVQMEPYSSALGLQRFSTPHKKPVQMQSIVGTPSVQNLSAPSKRIVRNESMSSKSGSQQSRAPKNRVVQIEPSPRNESFESVRSKMRESLAAALALVSQHQDKAPNEEKNHQSEAAGPPRQTQGDSLPAESSCTTADHVPTIPLETFPSKESCSIDKPNGEQNTPQDILSKDSMSRSAQTWNCVGQESQCNTVLPERDASFGDNFFVKDDLLQGNGLSWALDLHREVSGKKEVQTVEKPKLVHGDVVGDRIEKMVQSPQTLATKIEAELFKLFGGVNKKYKEKGRSLLFNLKDPSNPELRERVNSGEISPERLCSMTAEDLASEELSQWRMAKAEELAQMKVLPDSDVDIRRLVKKTHKGEFQVEVEQDDGVSVEVSAGTSSLTHFRSKSKETETQSPSKSDGSKGRENVEGEKTSLENQDQSCSLTISSDGTDGTDLLQGLMVDELKDAELLPPIVSLDEFMESLDSEPPFENLQLDAGKMVPQSDLKSSEAGHKSETSDIASKDPVDATPVRSEKNVETDEMCLNYAESDVKVKSSESPVEQKKSPPCEASKVEHIWEGVLQLNISVTVTVVGCFRSGEETSTKEWPSSLEIKGRVRLDAFDKFLQELPMSRSRAVMVVQFVLKEGTSENERTSLCEVVDSYVLDERLGFAEPAPGVELYLCPIHTKILEMLTKHLPKDHTDVLKSIDSGLIGIVVWRKAHLSSIISPKSSSYHKRSSKKQHLTSRKHQDKETNVNVNYAQERLVSRGVTYTNPKSLPDDDDDVPPGFGPPAARDEDDLPEFNFSAQNHPFSNSALKAPSRPGDHMRELVHKYGQIGGAATLRNWQEQSGARGGGVHQWNDDEDDDIPEWQPQATIQHPPPPPAQPPNHGFQQPVLSHQQLLGLGGGAAMPVQLAAPVALATPNLQPPAYVMQGGWLGQPSLQHSQGGGGEYYGAAVLRAGPPSMEWRQGVPRSRGF